MAFWDGKTISYMKDEPYLTHPGWSLIDCGCCVGIEWGGDYPRECRRCGGSGAIARHDASKTLALYPGGPFAGKA